MDDEKKTNNSIEPGHGTNAEAPSTGKRSRPAAGGGFVRQAAILAGAGLFVRLLGFFYRIPLTHLIGDSGNSFYSPTYTIYIIVLALTSSAMIPAVSRLTSERIALGQFRNAHSLFKTALCFSMLLGAVGSFVMFFGAKPIILFFNVDGPLANFFVLPAETIHGLRAISPAIFVVSVLTVLRGYFQGMKTAAPTAISQVVEQIFNVSFSLWLAFLFFDAADITSVQFAAAGAAGGTAIAAVAALGVVAFIYLLVAKALKKRAAEDETEFIEKPSAQIFAIAKTARPISIGLLIFAVISLLDMGMANSRIYASGVFTTDEINTMVGQFTGKFVLITILPVMLSMALSAAVLPEITSAHVTLNKQGVRQKTNLALRISMMLTIPSAVGLAVLADPIIKMIFSSHPEGGFLITYGAVSMVFLAIVHVVTGVLQGVGRIKLPVIGVLIGVLIKLPLNYFLMEVPAVNILGAVISTVVCFAAAAAVSLYFLHRVTGIRPDFVTVFFKPILASAGMGAVCFIVYHLLEIISSNAIATLGAIVAGVFSYAVLMTIIRGFGEREINSLPLPARVKRWMRF